MKQWDMNQLVGYNMLKARQLRGWTQEKAASEVAAVGAVGWTKATWSAAERSVDGKRIRQFTPNDLMDFSRAFDLPLMFWLLPPGSDDTEVWFYLFHGYEKPSRGLYGQAAVSYFLKDFRGEVAKRLERTGLSGVAREIAGEPNLERLTQLVGQSDTLHEVADLLDATVAAVAETILDRTAAKEVSRILEGRTASTSAEPPEATAPTQGDAPAPREGTSKPAARRPRTRKGQ